MCAGLSLLATLTACGKPAATRCAPSDMACVTKALENHPVRDAAFWQPRFQQPLAQRIGPAPAALIEYLTLENQRSGFAERPRPAPVDAAFDADLRAAFDELPAVVRQGVAGKLAGIFLVQQLGGTGFAEQAYDRDGAARLGFIVLDQDKLTAHTANAWATWKENTPFAAAEGHRLSVRIAEDAQDDRRRAIQYILLHEMGHIVSIGAQHVPNWNEPPARHRDLHEYPFFNLSWLVDAASGHYASRFDAAFALRPKVAYYRQPPPLKAADMPASYRQLLGSNFATLYAATSPADDFAESYVNYIHTVLMGRPFAITIEAPGTEPLVYTACWTQPRCADKRAVFDDLFNAARP